MTHIIAIANQKGGVGKTTTAVNLAATLALQGKTVLLLDMDPQGNASSGLGVASMAGERSIYNVLVDGEPLAAAVQPTSIERLSVVPSGKDLSGAEVELVSAYARETRLKKALKAVANKYDYVFIDCPPSIGLLTVNALAACGSVLIPMQCEYYALEGLSSLLETVKLIRSSLNPKLAIEGILLTMYDARNNLCRQVVADVRKHFAKHVYKTVIPRNVRLSEASSHAVPVGQYDAASRGALAYVALAKEVLKLK